ncbi:MAG: CotH kinase family protein [Chloroflexi bacterium]|nr:CotH kinase family protein [Chloroflexota bacterium]
MKIGQQQPARLTGFLKRNLRWLGALLLVFILGLIAGGQEWHAMIDGLRTLPARLFQSAAHFGDLPTLVVDMNATSYNGILGQRERALQDGVYIPAGRDFVTATICLNDSVVPVRMRLLEGPADHLGDDEKWGFEVRTRQNQRLLGMQRFYLQDPSANNWLNEWAFARALEREGILVARYQFVHLVLNGDNRGIYALQEGFANELLMAQGRPAGVIVRFDADLLWESIAHFQGDARAAYADSVANLSATDFQYFEVDTFRDAAISRDPELSAQRDQAIGLLRALQTGELEPSDVFDVEQYGLFLALVDLWGATQGTSLVNLHYYHNPATARLEPIGFNTNALGADARLSLLATYNDPVLQAAYAQETLRISQPEYLDQLQAELEPEFRQLQQAVSAAYREIEPPWDQLRDRQEQIRRSLSPVQPVFAYLGSPELAADGILRVDVGNVLNLPVEIVGFDIHGATVLPANRQWVQAESDELLTDSADQVVLRAFDAAQAPVMRYAHFDIPLAEIHRLDDELDFMQELDVQVITRILGLSATQMTLARHGYPDVLVVETDQ